MYIVIMAGGKGTRFWPRSRAATPKQLLDITGEQTMIQQTVERVLPVSGPEKILIVTNAEQAEELQRQLPVIPAENIIIEPVGRNTAPCICLAATKIHKTAPGEVMAVLPADHHIGSPDAFVASLRIAEKAAADTGALVTFGIQPNAPETGYGYIEYDAGKSTGLENVFTVLNFHEKPDRKRAQQYLAQGNFLWNSGMFIWKTSVILDYIENLLPAMYAGIKPVEELWDTPEIGSAIAKAYEQSESISIDYGVMEKADNVLTIPGDFGWNDIGSWSAIYDIAPKDADGNALRGDVVMVDAGNNFVHAQKTTAIVGLDNIVVVETDDAVLVCARDRVQDVRKVVDELEKKGRKELL